jgi:acyl-CoA reductase-like NAD-dependent aldehyde dehydrogenase
MDRNTRMGPLAREDLYTGLEQHLKEMPKSYKIVYQRMDMKKPHFPITVIEGTDETWDMELFGPCFQLFRA